MLYYCILIEFTIPNLNLICVFTSEIFKYLRLNPVLRYTCNNHLNLCMLQVLKISEVQNLLKNYKVFGKITTNKVSLLYICHYNICPFDSLNVVCTLSAARILNESIICSAVSTSVLSLNIYKRQKQLVIYIHRHFD